MDTEPNGVRNYPRRYRMVWIAVILMVLLIIAEWTGILYRPIQEAQQNLLNDRSKKYVDIIGTVTESKKGQSYFFMQAQSGEYLYVTIPYAYYDIETQTSTVWYPTGTKLEIQYFSKESIFIF